MANTIKSHGTRLSSLVLFIGITCCLAFTAHAQSGPGLIAQDSFNAEGVTSAPAPPATRSAAHWARFSDGLVEALSSDNDGARQGALRMIIFYGDELDVTASVFDVVRIYRNHDDDRLRRMAVVALGKMKSDWALDFLKRSVRFEKTPSVRQTIQAVIAAYEAPQPEAEPAALQLAKKEH